MSIFVLNIATMLGLALAIDYSLFIVSRYREELRRGRSVGDAVERAVGDRRQGRRLQRAGGRDRPVRTAPVRGPGHPLDRDRRRARRAVLGGLLADLPAGRARDARPSGQRPVDQRAAASLPAGRRTASRSRRTRRWERVAHGVMRRPVAVLIPTLLFLLLLGSPFLRLVQGVPGAEIYPPGVESRDAYVALQTEFAPGETTPITILADVAGSPTSLDNIRALDAYAAQVDALEGIDRVEGPFAIHDPATGAPLSPSRWPSSTRCPPSSVRPASTPWPPSTSAAPRSASTPSARWRRRARRRPTSSRRSAPSRRRRHHHPGRRQRRERPRLPRVAGRARALCRRR